MMDMSSVMDASLALLGAGAVLIFGIWVLATQSSAVSAAPQVREPDTPELRRAA